MSVAFSPKRKPEKTLGQEDHQPAKPLHTQMTSGNAKATGKPAPEGEQEAGEDVSHMDIHDVIQQHGPASKAIVEHDHEGGQHHKTSHHGGAMHKSSHGSAKEAHDAAAMASGVDGDMNGESAESDSEGGEMALPGMKHKGY